MAMIERITSDMPVTAREGHEFRYRLAGGYVRDYENVVDLGCGVGYGSVLVRSRLYTGIDITDVIEPEFRPYGRWVTADLCAWEPDIVYDIAVCFETLEHVTDPDPVIDLCCRARRLAICSVPVVPTVGENPFHFHDFTVTDLPERFAERGWRCVQHVLQPSELSAVYVFARQ